jgi:hypothetical protein
MNMAEDPNPGGAFRGLCLPLFTLKPGGPEGQLVGKFGRLTLRAIPCAGAEGGFLVFQQPFADDEGAA